MNDYPLDWPQIAVLVKERAGWRCVRCNHPTEPLGLALPCDDHCLHNPNGKQRMLTVHHLDGDKANVEWWNIPPLCQVCHLYVQHAYHPDQTDFAFLEGEPWLMPYVTGRRLAFVSA